jgi:1-deoxy-D-xylulose-5-phosphate synthase
MANHHEGPVAIRYPRGAGTGAVPKKTPRLLEFGKSEVIRHGTDVALFGLGNFCEVATEVADLLEKGGIKAAVINPRWIKPLDTVTLEFFARGTRLVCTLEDHAITGGFGSAVAEHLSDAGITTPLVRLGWPDQFIEHGSVAILRAKYGLSPESIAARIRSELSEAKTLPVTKAGVIS